MSPEPSTRPDNISTVKKKLKNIYKTPRKRTQTEHEEANRSFITGIGCKIEFTAS